MKNEDKDTLIEDKQVADHPCMKCPWLDKQPEGNPMLCILPGKCYKLKSWSKND